MRVASLLDATTSVNTHLKCLLSQVGTPSRRANDPSNGSSRVSVASKECIARIVLESLYSVNSVLLVSELCKRFC